MKVVVIGGAGMLGSEVAMCAHERMHHVIVPSHDEVDVLRRDMLDDCIGAFRPDIVVNCAAMLSLPLCEEDPQLAYDINAKGSENVGASAARYGAKYVYISTGCVFGKDATEGTVYLEHTNPNPWCSYGLTKQAGELLAMKANPQTYIVRVSALYGPAECRGKGYNFPQLVFRQLKDEGSFTVDTLQRFCPTYAPDAAEALWDAVEKYRPNIYHLTNSGVAQWQDVAAVVKEVCELKGEIRFATEMKTERPKSVVLFNASPIRLRLWTLALNEYCRKHLIPNG